MTPTLTDDDLRAMFKRCLNWGRWGDDDQAGTLNLITPVKRRRAARLVRSGRSGSFTRPLLCLLDYPEVTTLRAMCARRGHPGVRPHLRAVGHPRRHRLGGQPDRDVLSGRDFNGRGAKVWSRQIFRDSTSG